MAHLKSSVASTASFSDLGLTSLMVFSIVFGVVFKIIKDDDNMV